MGSFHHMRPAPFFLVAGACLLLSGCVDRYEWQKPGASQSEYEQIKALCLIEGHNQVPANEHMEMTAPASSTSSSGCSKKHGCSSTTSYAPPQYGMVDENQPLRDQIVRACFFRNGWQEIKVQEGLIPSGGF